MRIKSVLQKITPSGNPDEKMTDPFKGKRKRDQRCKMT